MGDGLSACHRDLAVGHEEQRRSSPPWLRMPRRSPSVAGRGADHGFRAVLLRHRHRGRHPAVLERPGRVEAFIMTKTCAPRSGQLLAGMNSVPPPPAGSRSGPHGASAGGQHTRGSPAAVTPRHSPSTRMTDTTSHRVERPRAPRQSPKRGIRCPMRHDDKGRATAIAGLPGRRAVVERSRSTRRARRRSPPRPRAPPVDRRRRG